MGSSALEWVRYVLKAGKALAVADVNYFCGRDGGLGLLPREARPASVRRWHRRR